MELQLPGIGYRQGNRLMVTTAMDPVALVKTVAQPDPWNPVGTQPHGNRPQDKAHRKGIAEYLESEEQFVLGAVVLYAKKTEARFEPEPGKEERAVMPGTLYLNYGAQFDVGDGQHRIGAYSDVIQAHSEDDDPVMKRLRSSGQPLVVVIDDNPLHRAQDFTDLQRNAKPPSASIGLSMDRRQPINRLMIQLVQWPELRIFGKEADRVEFFKDSPGKLSAKLFSFKTIRYLGGTALIGVSQRATKTWDKAVNEYVEAYADEARQKLTDLWSGFATWPDIAQVLSGNRTAADMREKTYLASSGVLYSIAYAVYMASTEHKIPVKDAMARLSGVKYTRPGTPKPGELLTAEDTPFAGTLVDPESGKVGSGRPAWEAAAEVLLQHIRASS
ncbi:DNA sulfur modification protein DndB [Streptomyces sp. ZG43]|uniref:DGQHR domain-containing protein n=1 Tax=Streptomyces albidoflavus TaxID=1886 RepID=A0ABY3GRN2_9ACTN|nr:MULTISPECIES: DNA sulfur modification protein DndB [Streptomyces albidoflavus group]TWV18753.1 DGQHR domain-containing protein [Streptomyces albidoflavus]